MSNILWYPGHELIVGDIVRAENCHLYDSSGKRYVDLESGVWCTSIGHSHPRIKRVIEAQLGRAAHAGFNYGSEVVESAAAEILSLLGFDGGRCVFLCSGSEAVEYGVRVAQTVSRRPLLMTMTDSYFGAYGSAKQRRDDEWFSYDWMVCADCSQAAHQEGKCQSWNEVPFDRIGGFLLEPGSSSGFVRFPPKWLVQDICTRIKDDGGLILVNEVTTGFGRTGEWFGHQHYDISPDIASMGKGIGNGYPVSVAAFAPDVVERLGGEPLAYAQSHQNDPLGAAVAREVIRIIHDEKLVERGREVADVFLPGLQRIGERGDHVADVRGRGLMAAVDIRDDTDATLTVRIHRELVDHGYLVGRRPGMSVLRIDPALTIEPEDVIGFLGELEDVLAGS
jgi:acetylornithine aminotransferase